MECGSMNDTNAAIDKLQRIQQLWKEMGQTKSDTPEYQALLKKIRVLSAEYQAIVDTPVKPQKPK
jgi:hypothetical protein